MTRCWKLFSEIEQLLFPKFVRRADWAAWRNCFHSRIESQIVNYAFHLTKRSAYTLETTRINQLRRIVVDGKRTNKANCVWNPRDSYVVVKVRKSLAKAAVSKQQSELLKRNKQIRISERDYWVYMFPASVWNQTALCSLSSVQTL